MQPQLPDDFSPIAEHGELRREPGVFGRFKQQRDLPATGLGFERIIIDTDGRPLSGGNRLTAGESYWSKRSRTWIKIDIGDHTLAYTFNFLDQTGRAGFIATVTVSCAVVNTTTVAQRRISSVKSVLEPLLREAVVSASDTVEPISDPDPVLALTKTRRSAERVLREHMLGSVQRLPDWLTATVSSISVAFDATTKRHHDGLVDRTRAGELIGAESENKKREATGVLDLRNMWRESLSKHFDDPASRALETVLGDPSLENLRAVANELNHAEDSHRAALWDIVEELIRKDYFDPEDDAVKAIIDAMRSELGRHPQRSLGAASRTPPTEIAEISADVSEVIEADVDDHQDQATDDKNWNDP